MFLEDSRISKDAKKLRKDFREKYAEIADDFSKLSEKMDKFLAELSGE